MKPQRHSDANCPFQPKNHTTVQRQEIIIQHEFSPIRQADQDLKTIVPVRLAEVLEVVQISLNIKFQLHNIALQTFPFFQYSRSEQYEQ